ncbi:hypothetical protein RRG08_008151 [Elysia crispata]|uniref:Uncharacterized protein n=1 Tax=Elysia crispata TaxID=231223 RepID=A0AAE0Z576_9GAST|nr:hypothetical protein RRG08_008151 [Elysia crispata]
MHRGGYRRMVCPPALVRGILGGGGGREGCPELSSVGQFCWASFQFNDGRCSVYEQCQKHIILVDNVLCSSNSTFRGTVSLRKVRACSHMLKVQKSENALNSD